MVKTHEIDLDAKAFEQFTNSNYLIMKVDDIAVDDYILFIRTMTVEGTSAPTGEFRMTQVKSIVTGEGLEDGYALVTVNKL